MATRNLPRAGHQSRGTEGHPDLGPNQGLRLQGNAATNHSTYLPGETVGRYQILEFAGIEGRWERYSAVDFQSKREISLHILHRSTELSTEELGTLHSEWTRLTRLGHLLIVPILEIGQINGRPYLAFQRAQGRPLSEMMTALRFSPEEAVRLVASVAEALDHAHTQGVVHRGVRPSSIVISAVGTPHLRNFGLATTMGGTPSREPESVSPYQSPEQLTSRHQSIGPSADIYSLGVLFYQLLTGQLPYNGTSRQLTRSILVGRPPAPSSLNDGVSKEIDEVCLKAMARIPEDRYQSGSAMAEDLWRSLDGLQQLTNSPEPKQQQHPRRGRGRFSNVLKLSAAIVFAFALGSSLVLAFVKSSPAPIQPVITDDSNSLFPKERMAELRPLEQTSSWPTHLSKEETTYPDPGVQALTPLDPEAHVRLESPKTPIKTDELVRNSYTPRSISVESTIPPPRDVRIRGAQYPPPLPDPQFRALPPPLAASTTGPDDLPPLPPSLTESVDIITPQSDIISVPVGAPIDTSSDVFVTLQPVKEPLIDDPIPDFSATGICLTCGTGHIGPCIPGTAPCELPVAHTALGRILVQLYGSIFCPDPCYQPSWVPEAYAGLFPDYARPQTLTRFRYDYANNWAFPDRNEYFWAAAGSIEQSAGTFTRPGRGPKPFDINLPTRISERLPGNPTNLQDAVRGSFPIDVHQLYFYQEIATGRASFFIEFPYRSYSALFYPDNSSTSSSSSAPNIVGSFIGHAAGFSDMNLGTKSMLLDTELLQITFQFRTYLPIGRASLGLGNGHVSLEPSLLTTLKLAPSTFFQGQLSEWIPIGGNQEYAGALIHYKFSLNHRLYRFTNDSPLIGTFEVDGYTFQDGLYSDPFFGPQNSSGGTYMNIGPGLRLSLRDRADIGTSFTYPVTKDQFGEPYYRLELRLVY